MKACMGGHLAPEMLHCSQARGHITCIPNLIPGPATRLSRLPSSFGVAVHVVAGRTCSSGIVRPLFEDPDSLVPRQGPWHELQLSWGCHAAPRQADKVFRWRPAPAVLPRALSSPHEPLADLPSQLDSTVCCPVCLGLIRRHGNVSLSATKASHQGKARDS